MLTIHQRYRRTDRRTDGRHTIAIRSWHYVHRAVKILISSLLQVAYSESSERSHCLRREENLGLVSEFVKNKSFVNVEGGYFGLYYPAE